MKQSILKKKSDKQIARDILWSKAKRAREKVLEEKYGAIICEFCGRPPWGNELGRIEAHHINRDRRNGNTEDNCFLCHAVCHGEITLNRLKVKQLGFEGIKNVDI